MIRGLKALKCTIPTHWDLQKVHIAGHTCGCKHGNADAPLHRRLPMYAHRTYFPECETNTGTWKALGILPLSTIENRNGHVQEALVCKYIYTLAAHISQRADLILFTSKNSFNMVYSVTRSLKIPKQRTLVVMLCDWWHLFYIPISPFH